MCCVGVVFEHPRITADQAQTHHKAPGDHPFLVAFRSHLTFIHRQLDRLAISPKMVMSNFVRSLKRGYEAEW